MSGEAVRISPFDLAAAGYDSEFDGSPVTRHNRQVIHRSLLRRFHHGDHVLELACGTGTDAIVLAGHGVKVTATDASEEMLRRAQEKTRLRNLDPMITFRRHAVEDLEAFSGTLFDGAFSNFGGLNCTPELGQVVRRLAAVIRPGGTFVACLLNRVCLWEILSFALRGKHEASLRRFAKGGADARVGGLSQHVWYYSPRSFLRLLDPWFEAERIYGISIVSPSSSSGSFSQKHPFMTDSLMVFDDLVRTLPPFRALGDHFVVEARRRPGGQAEK